jgi:putative transposase
MRQRQCRLKASTVHGYAGHLLRQALEPEQQQYQPAVPLGVVASVLILAACWQTSITGACQLVKDQPSHRHVRDCLYACLPPRPRDLLSRLLHALRQTLPDHLFGRPRVMALDLHQIPYYGKKNTKGSTRRKKKASTNNSFTYATLAVLDRAGRFSVGLLHVRPHMRLTTIVGQLLGQAEEVGLQVSYLMLDKEFYCAEVIDLLQQRGVPFLMPALKRGRKGTGNSRLFEPTTEVGWYDYSWTTDLRRMDFKTKKRHKRGTLSVQVRMCVARHQETGKPVVFAAWGLGKWPPALVVDNYRRRFGIEAQYRQMGQCLARTSARGERLRLLLVGLALLLCNLWAYLHSEVFSTGPVSERYLHLPQARLATILAAVAAHIATLFGGYVDSWPTQRPLPPPLAPFADSHGDS